jgi:hypothetical protein
VELAYPRAFMRFDLNKDPEGFHALIIKPLGEMFPPTYNFYEPTIYLKDEAYKFFVKT